MMPKANKTPTISPITFIDRLIKENELGQPFTLMDHQREILRLAFAFDDNGLLPWNTIIYSCIKKSGKTTLNGAVTLGWGFTQEAPNEILILANDLEQNLARIFRTMEGIIGFGSLRQPSRWIWKTQLKRTCGITMCP